MPKKCKSGFKLRQGKCVRVGNSVFRPQEGLRRGFLWTALIALAISAIIGAGFFLIGEFNETMTRIVLTTIIVSVVAIGLLFVSAFRDRVVSTTSMLSLAVSGLLWVLLVWDVFEGGGFGEVISTTIVLLGGTLLALLSYSNKNNIIKSLGVTASVVAFALWFGVIWEMLESTDGLLRVVWSLSILAFALAHTTLISIRRSRDTLVRGIFWAVIALIAIVTSMLIWMVFNIDNVSETFWRVLGFFAVLDVAGSIALPILRRVRG